MASLSQTISDEELLNTLKTIEECGGSVGKASKIIGINPSNVYARIRKAARRGLSGTQPVMPGFEISKVSTKQDQDGTITSTYVTQKPEGGSEYEIPKNMMVNKATVNLDGNGNVIQEWLKLEKGHDPDLIARTIKQAFEDWLPKSPILQAPSLLDSDRLVVYLAMDWHFGLFAWAKETGGEDWDLTIARRVILEAMTELVEQSPPAEHAILLGLGDLMHADSSSNMTARSGNVLDVDTRYAKVLEMTCDLLADVVEIISTKHKNVKVVFKPGNHDENSTVGIRCAMRMLFRENERIDVCSSPDPFFWDRFGINLIGGVHGDKAKIKDLPLIMANRRKDDWAVTKTRHIFTGHIHHNTALETGGVTVYSVRAPVAQDAYHAANGYLSGRSVISHTYHREKGHRGSTEIELT